MSNEYLGFYQSTHNKELTRGLGGFFRRMLDLVANARGQRDRHALFLPRVLELAQLSYSENAISVLELGCGDGKALSYSHPNIHRIAVDNGTFFRESLESLGTEFYVLDISSQPLPLKNQSINLVMMNHVIEHIANSDFLLAEIRRVLKDGGFLYLRTPNIERVGWSFWDDHTHIKPFTIVGLDSLMKTHKFERMCLYYSDHPRINLDILSGGMVRPLLFGEQFGGREIETLYRLQS